MLIIEDDVRFAEVLCNLGRELSFHCVVVHSANDGLAAAALYHPHAILLDMNLPDYSGLGVLDQLKRNPDTRHIPVHIISVADHSHQALERGAVGYAMKPVRREELVEAFRKLEAKMTQGVRRVLVVEDDERQRESIRQLLGTGNVQITGVGTAAHDAPVETPDGLLTGLDDDLQFPCRIPLAEQDDVSFPPVIVYTGRSLTRDEEQQLGRFSRSIIIKDARSPERLLDEVTLFLHQVESSLPAERQRMLKVARDRDAALEGRRILVVEDDARNIFALSSVLEPKGARVEIARNGREAIDALTRSTATGRTADRSRPDGHHDARDGRAHGDARDPEAPRVEEAADHRAHRQGDEGRPGEVPRRRGQRLHRQTPRRGEAPVSRACMDAEVGARGRQELRHRASAPRRRGG
jgi:CheY-like chemotaxis protein